MGNQTCCSETNHLDSKKLEYEIITENFQGVSHRHVMSPKPSKESRPPSQINIQVTRQRVEKQFSMNYMDTFNKIAIERIASNEVYFLIKKRGNLLEFLNGVDADFQFEENSFFLGFLFKRIQKALKSRISESKFDEVLKVMEKHKVFLSKTQDVFLAPKKDRKVLILQKVALLTKICHFVHFSLMKKSGFGKFWEGNGADFAQQIEREIEQTNNMTVLISSKESIDQGSNILSPMFGNPNKKLTSS